MLDRYLNDRNIFPSTMDVINFANSIFDCRINYEQFRRRGRRDLIKKVLKHLFELPISLRESMLKNFFSKLQSANNESSAYQELFKILTRNE